MRLSAGWNYCAHSGVSVQTRAIVGSIEKRGFVFEGIKPNATLPRQVSYSLLTVP